MFFIFVFLSFAETSGKSHLESHLFVSFRSQKYRDIKRNSHTKIFHLFGLAIFSIFFFSARPCCNPYFECGNYPGRGRICHPPKLVSLKKKMTKIMKKKFHRSINQGTMNQPSKQSSNQAINQSINQSIN